MKSLKQNKKFTTWCWIIFSLIIMPGYTFYFAHLADLYDQNFSYIGNYRGYPFQLVVWGIINSIYLYVGITYLYNLIHKRNRFIKILITIGCSFLIITVFMPFDTTTGFDLPHILHNTFGYTFVVIFNVTFIYFLYLLIFQRLDIFIFSCIWYSIVMGISFYLYGQYEISSLLQMYFMINMYFIICFISLLLKLKERKIEELKDINS